MKNIILELSEADQEKLMLLAEQHTVRELEKIVSKPKPEGLGIEVSRASLDRWVRMKRAKRVEESAEETKRQAKAIKEQVGEEGGELEEGALAMLRQRFFEEAARTMRTTDVALMYRSMRELLFKEQRIALARERAKISREYLELARERFQFNAARMALEYADELGEIARAEGLDDEEKIYRARARLFGKEVIDGIKNIGDCA